MSGERETGEGVRGRRKREIARSQSEPRGLSPRCFIRADSRDSRADSYVTLLVSQRMTRMDANVSRQIAPVGERGFERKHPGCLKQPGCCGVGLALGV
jgi:hypothetical protein